MSDDVSTAAYWENLYQTKENGWDKGRGAPPILRMFDEGFLPKGARLAVVGAGPGYEVVEAARRGFQVTAIDFAPTSLRQLREGREQSGTDFEILDADLFTVPKTRAGQFDAVLEHTCFCAIDVARRAEYVEVVYALLVPRGVLFGLFYAHGKEGGPPYTTTEAEVRGLFGARFSFERLVCPPDSFEVRQGKELEFVLRR
jgi:methyl halide transferase